MTWVLSDSTQIKKGGVGNEKMEKLQFGQPQVLLGGKGEFGCVCGLGSLGTWMCLSRQHLLMTEKSENIKNTPVLITATGVAAGKEMEQVEAK